jgi:14-3-3 protein epsilon
MSKPLNVTLSPCPDELSAEQAIEMAKLAETAERFEDMAAYMGRVVKEKSGNELTVDERNMISVAYKNMMTAYRTAWRQICDAMNSEDLNSAYMNAAGEYKEKVAGELKKLITKVEAEIKVFISGPSAATKTTPEGVEILVFFQKMKGDYNRYGAEVSSESDKMNFTTKAEAAYKEALALATEGEASANLPATNPIRLGLALNYSVFMYEILAQKTEAAEMASTAFKSAMEQLDTLDESQYRDSTLIMQLLQDNIGLWDEHGPEDEE